MNENISYISNRVELAENASNGNLVAKFCLCDFGVNHNGVQLNRDTIEPWVGTLLNQPLVGRIGYNGDFTGHNMRVATITNSEGESQTEVVFDTEAIGTFVSAGIEEIDGEEYVVGTAEIWRRYPTVCNLIAERVSEGTLHTSWEIIVSESHMDGNVKVIDNGTFTALCALGRNHPPAYDSSQLLEVAESEEDTEFEEAISNDVANYKIKEVSPMTDETIISEEIEVQVPEVSEDPIVVDVAEPVIEEPTPDEAEVFENTDDTEVAEPETEEPVEPEVSEDAPEVSEPEAEPEIASLTDRDIKMGIEKILWDEKKVDGYVAFMYPEEHTALVWTWGANLGELDYIQYTYAVNGDEITLDDGVKVRLEANVLSMSETIASQNEALVEASQRIKGLEAEIAELKPYKEAAEQAEAEKLMAEKQAKISALEEYASKSGFITSKEISEDGEIKTMISELNESGIKQIIAERFMASLQEKTNEVIVSEAEEKNESAELNLEVSDDEDVSIISAYINKK